MPKREGAPLRPDMTRAKAEGYKAFQDDVPKFPNPYDRTPDGTLWSEGWKQAEHDERQHRNEEIRR